MVNYQNKMYLPPATSETGGLTTASRMQTGAAQDLSTAPTGTISPYAGASAARRRLPKPTITNGQGMIPPQMQNGQQIGIQGQAGGIMAPQPVASQGLSLTEMQPFQAPQSGVADQSGQSLPMVGTSPQGYGIQRGYQTQMASPIQARPQQRLTASTDQNSFLRQLLSILSGGGNSVYSGLQFPQQNQNSRMYF